MKIAVTRLPHGADLPLPTRIVIALSDNLVRFFPFILVGGGAAAYGFKAYYATENGRHVVDGVTHYCVTFEHFGQHVDLLLELFDDRIAMMLEFEARKGGHAEAEFLRPQHHAIAVHHSHLLQAL